jgi:hypothetical protein
VIAKQLVDPLARALLAGTYAPGDRVVADAVDGALTFRAAVGAKDEAAAEPAAA